MLKVDHAGEHGAVCIYRAQGWIARWRAPELVPEIEYFLEHEQRHRQLFETELKRRNVRHCRSIHLCGLGGFVLGTTTALLGTRAIALTTEAVESVVLRHLEHQLSSLSSLDPAAAATVAQIIADEQEHHDRAGSRLVPKKLLDVFLRPPIRAATEAVIWFGMWPKNLTAELH